MQSVLEQFAHGNISPEPRYFKKDSHFGKTMQELSDIEEKLIETLSDEQKTLLTNFTNTQMKLNSLTSVDKFIYGYRLGVLMTMEVFNGQDDLFVGSEGMK